MKTTKLNRRGSSPSGRMKAFAPHLCGLISCAGIACAQVSLTFDTDVQGVVAGGDATSVTWDAANGGSLAVETTGGWKPSCAYLDLNSADPAVAALKEEFMLALTNGGTLSYDIIVATDSVTGGNPGWFETMYIGNSSAGWDQTYGAGKGQITAYGAFPLAAPLLHTVTYTIENASSVASDTIAQFNSTSGWLQINIGLNSEGGTAIRYFIDNITVNANDVEVPVVIPQTKITPIVPGLNIVSSGVGQYDRQCIRTAADLDVSWVGGTFPKTYELTIAEYPTVVGYESVIYFVPGTGILTSNNNPDYSQPVCAGVWIYPNGDGTGSFAMRYKDHVANSNGPAGNEYWMGDPAPSHGLGGQLAAVNSASMLGTWKITFTSDTDFTMTSPDGSTNTGSFNPATAAKFAGPMHVYFGNVPSQAANIGLEAVYSRIKITGTGYPIDEDLTTGAYSSDLEVSASVPASVVQVTPDLGAYWFHWTLPATDFEIKQSTDFGSSDPWVTIPATDSITTKFGKKLLLLNNVVTSTENNFFRMEKPGTP